MAPWMSYGGLWRVLLQFHGVEAPKLSGSYIIFLILIAVGKTWLWLSFQPYR